MVQEAFVRLVASRRKLRADGNPEAWQRLIPLPRPTKLSRDLLVRIIADKLREKIRDPQGQSIYVRADENVPFGAFATVMDAVKSSGIANVSIVTEPIQQGKTKK